MEQIKSEGEKVAKNENIFRYYSKNEENLKKQIAELDVKIQETMKKQTDLYPADVKLVENQIDEEIEKLNKTTDISKLTEYEKKINQLITKKAKIVGEKSPSGSYLKQLNNQRVKLEKELNEGTETIKAPKSGILSYKVDGLEETLTPENGQKAVEKYPEAKPDLVLMDITMPEMDGIEALKKIKALDPGAKIIMCSAMGQQAMVIEAIQAGAKDFIVKPFQAERVLEAVKKVVG